MTPMVRPAGAARLRAVHPGVAPGWIGRTRFPFGSLPADDTVRAIARFALRVDPAALIARFLLAGACLAALQAVALAQTGAEPRADQAAPHPDRLEDLDAVIAELAALVRMPDPPPVATCPWSVEDPEGLTRQFDELLLDYDILERIIDDATATRGLLYEDYRASLVEGCAETFVSALREQVAELEGVEIDTALQTARTIGDCAAPLVADVSADSNDIARDLAYFADKRNRLLGEYEDWLDQCARIGR